MISKDGGKTFKSQYLIGGDHHVMWIDPPTPRPWPSATTAAPV